MLQIVGVSYRASFLRVVSVMTVAVKLLIPFSRH
jgi:hypothetical protein